MNWCKFIKHFVPPLESQCWQQNEYPLVNINLVVNSQVNQKKKKDDQKDIYLYFEPSYQKILETMQEPLLLI